MTQESTRADQLEQLSVSLGLELRDHALLDRALTHASIFVNASEPGRDYESLEFLGDSVLGLAVSHYLFERLPDRTPGEYSRLRASVVNRRCLARVAGELGIASAIRLGKGEELSGGRERAALLADCLEALIGALYLDRGWEVARGFVTRVFAKEIERELSSDRTWDFKSRLQNFCQAARIPLPVFVVVRSEGPDHQKEFEVEVRVQGVVRGGGRGRSKKEAEQNAARVALEQEDQLLVPVAREDVDR